MQQVVDNVSTIDPDDPRLGPYRVVRSLGVGGMGEVLLARDPRLDRQVAIKRITGVGDATRRARFLREARLAGSLHHPAIVQVYDLLTLDDEHYIVMEWVRGGSLRQRLNEVGRLSLSAGLAILRSIAAGLEHAHERRVIHRDLKAENVLLDDGDQAKITDFGIARRWRTEDDLTAYETLTREGTTLGTVRAMSPEQVRGRALDPRSDLFALGVLCYEMFTGTSPFLAGNSLATATRIVGHRQPPADAVCGDLPATLARAIDRLLAKDAADRPETAGQVLTWLDEWLGDAAPSDDDGQRQVVPTPTSTPALDPRPEATTGTASERRELTLLACELFDRDDSRASIEWDAFYDVMDALRERARPILDRFHGYLGDDPGHRLLVYFGFPMSSEHASRHAVLAAHELIDCFSELADAGRLAMRIGIHSGPVRISERRGERRLMPGATADLAIAVEQHAGAGEVWLSETARTLVEGWVATDQAASIQHPGWPQPMALHRIRSTPRSSRGAVGDDRLFVGRHDELATLRQAWRDVRDTRRGRCLLVLGEAGIGKSHLLEAVRAELDGGAARWLACGASAHGQQVAFHAVQELIHQLFALSSDMEHAEQIARLRDGLAELGAGVDEALPLLAAMLSLSASELDEAPGLPDARRARTIDVLIESITTRARSQPVVLVCEDVHWFDPSSFEILEHLLDRLDDVPILLVLTARRRPPAFEPPPAAVDTLVLERLERSEVVEHIAGRAGADELAPELIEEIVERADGVPLFVDQLTRMFLRGVRPDEATPRGLGGGSGRTPSTLGSTNPIPLTLRESLAARLDQCGEARELALIASVIGRDFPVWLLVAVARIDETALRAGLETLVQAGLIQKRGFSRRQRYQFEHALIQEAAYRSLLDGTRRTWHARIATAIENRYFSAEQASTIIGSDVLPRPRGGTAMINGVKIMPLLTHHWMQAIDLERPAIESVRRAAAYARRTAEEELRLSAYPEALDKIDVMLALLDVLPDSPAVDELELELRLPQIHVRRVLFGIGSDEVKASYDRARRLCLRLGDRPELSQLLFGLGTYHQWNGEHHKSMVLAEECLEHARHIGDLSLLEEAHTAVFNSHYWLWNLDDAVRHGSRVFELHDPSLGEVHIVRYGHDPRIIVYQLMICLLWFTGCSRLAERLTRELNRLLEGVEHPYSVLLGDLARVVTSFRRRDFAGLRRDAESMCEMARRMQAQIFELDGTFFATWARVQTGEVDRVDELTALFEARRATTNRIAESGFLFMTATGLERAGRVADAVALLETARARGIGFHERPHEAELVMVLGRARAAAAVGAADRQAAEATLREAWEMADRRDQGLVLDDASVAWGELLRADGRGPEADRLATRTASRRAEIEARLEALLDAHPIGGAARGRSADEIEEKTDAQGLE